MCGLLYAFRQNGANASKTILKRFRHQKTRGLQGFGYISIDKGTVKEVKRFEEEASMIESLGKENANEILFHHRLPTGTPNFKDITHPIVVKNDLLKHNYYVIHNGIISNDEELKKEHEEIGFKYTTNLIKRVLYETANYQITDSEETLFNDSEAFAIDLALYLENKQEKIKSQGSIAFICLETTKKNHIRKIHYGHNIFNPLILEENRDMFVLKSEGHGKKLDADILLTMDYQTRKITENNVDIGIKPYGNFYNRQVGFYDEKEYSYEKEYSVRDNYWENLEQELEDLKKRREEIELELSRTNTSIMEGKLDSTDDDVIEFLSVSNIELEDINDSIDEIEKEMETQLEMDFS